MATPEAPPSAPGKIGKRLGKFPPWVYVLIAAGVVVAVVYLRRQSEPATVPAVDPTASIPVPDAAVGSFQGYDTPQDNSISGGQMLEFVLGIRDQNLAIAQAQVDAGLAYREQDLAALLAYDPPAPAESGPTGGGLPSDVIPNVAPKPRQAAPKPRAATNAKCPRAYPHRNGNRCYKVKCKGPKGNRFKWHIYRGGAKVKTGSRCK